MKYISKKQAFTLIELILYIAIISVIIGAIMGLYGVYSSGKEKARGIAEIEYSGNAISARIERAIRESIYIQIPATSTASSTLSLGMASSSKNPTIFKSIQNKIYISEGVGPNIPLHASSSLVDSLSFSNLSNGNSMGSVSFSFTLKTATTTGERSYTQSFHGSATIRK